MAQIDGSFSAAVARQNEAKLAKAREEASRARFRESRKPKDWTPPDNLTPAKPSATAEAIAALATRTTGNALADAVLEERAARRAAREAAVVEAIERAGGRDLRTTAERLAGETSHRPENGIQPRDASQDRLMADMRGARDELTHGESFREAMDEARRANAKQAAREASTEPAKPATGSGSDIQI